LVLCKHNAPADPKRLEIFPGIRSTIVAAAEGGHSVIWLLSAALNSDQAFASGTQKRPGEPGRLMSRQNL
jgi:hypothetical protein